MPWQQMVVLQPGAGTLILCDDGVQQIKMVGKTNFGDYLRSGELLAGGSGGKLDTVGLAIELMHNDPGSSPLSVLSDRTVEWVTLFHHTLMIAAYCCRRALSLA